MMTKFYFHTDNISDISSRHHHEEEDAPEQLSPGWHREWINDLERNTFKIHISNFIVKREQEHV